MLYLLFVLFLVAGFVKLALVTTGIVFRVVFDFLKALMPVIFIPVVVVVAVGLIISALVFIGRVVLPMVVVFAVIGCLMKNSHRGYRRR